MILHFTDLHFEQAAFAFISEKARELSADVCLTGDLIDQRRGSVSDQIAWVTRWARTQPFQLFLCGGNQDAVERPDDPYFVGWMDALHDGTSIVTRGSGRSRTTGRTVGCVPYGHIFALNDRTFDGVDVLLHHEPPAGSAVSVFDGEAWGSLELADYLLTALKPPALVLCGHVHSPIRPTARCGGSTVCNPGAFDAHRRIRYARISFAQPGREPSVALMKN